MTVEEKYVELGRLLGLGRERGYVLVDEILEVLPEEVASTPEELDEIYLRFTENDIEIVESLEKLAAMEEEAAHGERPETPEPLPGVTVVDPALLEKTNDPVRMYLREMGTVKLLDRDGEVVHRDAHRVGRSQGLRCPRLEPQGAGAVPARQRDGAPRPPHDPGHPLRSQRGP